MRFNIQRLITPIALSIASTTSAQDRMLEEVVVTATKRAESSQSIPIAITAIGASTIEKLAIRETEDLVRLSPSLTVSTGDNKQNSGFRLRGIGTNAFSIGVEQSVAVIIDEVATVQQGQSISDLADVERIEVLRGPQSTLFGKSASAGAISVTTKAPSEEFEGSIELAATDDDETRAIASVSGPITDSLRYRVSGYWRDWDGNVDNLSTGSKVNGQEAQGFRGKLLWQVNDDIDVTLIAHTSENESTCCALTWDTLAPTAQVFGFVPGEVAPGIIPSSENYQFRSDDGPVDETENSGASIHANIALGDFTLTSITAQNTWEYENDGDVDFSNVDVFGFFTGGALTGGFFSQSDVETDFFSQELRLVSPSYDNFEYLVGVYYAEADTDRSFLRNPGLPIIPSDWVATTSTETLALFGQFTWRFTDATSVTAGVRWNDEDIAVDFIDNLASSVIASTNNDDEVLGNVSLQHFLNENVMLYARYAQGYKGQAYDIATGFTQAEADNPVAPETSDSFSFGIKSSFFNNRLRLNATAFSAEYEDFQAQSTRIFPDGSLLLTLNNVGQLETRGIEIDGAALIGDKLTLTFGAAFIDAEIKEFLGSDCFAGQTEAQGCDPVTDTQDIRGGTLPNSPDSKFSVGAEYVQTFDAMPFDAFFLLTYVWQDEVNFNLAQNPRTVQDSYGVANLNFGINERSNDRYRVTAFVNNITDENYRSTLADLGGLYGGADAFAQSFSRNSERHIGVRLKLAF